MHHDLLEDPIPTTLLFFSLPILLGNIVQSLSGTITSIFLGRFIGPDALAATSNAFPVMFFILSSIFGVGMATTVFIGQYVGKGEIEDTKQVIGTSLAFFFISGLVLAFFGFFFADYFTGVIKTPQDIYPLTSIYIKYSFIGLPAAFGYHILGMVLRGGGDSRTPFIFLILATVLTLVLTPILTIGLFGFPKLGIAGAALASSGAQFITFLLNLWYIYRHKYFLCFYGQDFRYLRINLKLLGKLLKIGVPSSAQMVLNSLSMLALIQMVNLHGSIVTAAYGIAMQLASYVQMPAMAIGAAVSSITAQNLGARNLNRVKQITKWGLIYSFGITVIPVVLIYLFNREMLGWFTNDARVIEVGYGINHITVWSYSLFGLTFVMSGIIRAAGVVIVPTLIMVSTIWLIRIPLAYFLSAKIGMTGIWWSFPISFIFAVLAMAAYFNFGGWLKNKLV